MTLAHPHGEPGCSRRQSSAITLSVFLLPTVDTCCLLHGTLGLCHGLHPRACHVTIDAAASKHRLREGRRPASTLARSMCVCTSTTRCSCARERGRGGGRSRGAHAARGRPQAPAALSAAPPGTAPAAAERQPHVPPRAWHHSPVSRLLRKHEHEPVPPHLQVASPPLHIAQPSTHVVYLQTWCDDLSTVPCPYLQATEADSGVRKIAVWRIDALAYVPWAA